MSGELAQVEVGEVQRSPQEDLYRTPGYVTTVYSFVLLEGSANGVGAIACGRAFGLICGEVTLTLTQKEIWSKTCAFFDIGQKTSYLPHYCRGVADIYSFRDLPIFSIFVKFDLRRCLRAAAYAGASPCFCLCAVETSNLIDRCDVVYSCRFCDHPRFPFCHAFDLNADSARQLLLEVDLGDPQSSSSPYPLPLCAPCPFHGSSV